MKMYQLPKHHQNLSLKLSKVLSDLAVNHCLVQRTRKNALFKEKVWFMQNVLVNNRRITSFILGSTIEASTTCGLNSDFDVLSIKLDNEVIQTMDDWRQGSNQYLMVQNKFTSAGHCMLQKLSTDTPEPAKGIEDKYHSMNEAGDLFLKNNFCWELRAPEHSIHGPAIAVSISVYMEDHVLALWCRTWPHEAEAWLKINNANGWPTEDMKRYARNHGCFLVPVSSKTSVYSDLEWRISTSLMERRLMIGLNITQLRCYILMKMIIKDFVKPKFGDVISSFMCKCILLRCISQSTFRDWQDHTLVRCLLKCLRVLFQNIQSANFPHFIFPGNNLLAGKLSQDIKQQLETILIGLTDNIEQSLLRISIDNLGYLLNRELKECGMSASYTLLKRRKLKCFQTFTCIRDSYSNFNVLCVDIATIDGLKHLIQQMLQLFLNGGVLGQLVFRLMSPFLCVTIGSSLASEYIQHSRPLSREIMEWFKLGLCSDVASSKLKLASVFYCFRKFGKCENILKKLCRLLTEAAVVSFSCWRFEPNRIVTKKYPFVYKKDEVQAIKDYTVFCTVFKHCERNCVPKELQYEMFRSSKEDRGTYDFWMSTMVVDSPVYMYFLQYKVYQQRRKDTEKLAALTNLIDTINNDPDIYHKETALNLLGKCMEQENRKDLALKCYVRSLIVCPRHNAAKWHISLLVFSAFKSNEGL